MEPVADEVDHLGRLRATDAQPEQVMDLFPETIPVGAQFGVVLVVCREASEGEKPIHVEVATYRSDIGYAVKNPARVELTVDHQTGIAS